MKNPIIDLGILLLTIFLSIAIGTLALFFTNGSNDLTAIGLGIILAIVVLTFVGYLLYDLYSSAQDDHEQLFHGH